MISVLAKESYLPRDGFPIVVMRVTGGEDFSPHSHEFSELVVITGGHGVHVTGQETWPITAGDVFVITGKRAHGYQNARDLRLVNILYDEERLAMPVRDLQTLPGYHALFTLEPGWRRRHRFKSRLRLSMNELARVESLIDELIDELKSHAPGYRLMAGALFMRMVGFLSRCYSHAVAPAPRELFRIVEAISFLEGHYDKEIYLEKLAGIAHMSKRNFLRVFREAMGASPMAHLTGLRVARAAELLRQEDLNVTEIGYRVGFQDSNYFARQFRQLMGASPREYRERSRGLARRGAVAPCSRSGLRRAERQP